jgi:hypothetical protein
LLFGDNVRTDMLVDFKKGTLTSTGVGAEPIGVKRNEGDGTVPRPSAQFRAVTSALGREGVAGAVHASCFDANGFIPKVIGNIRALLTKP